MIAAQGLTERQAADKEIEMKFKMSANETKSLMAQFAQSPRQSEGQSGYLDYRAQQQRNALRLRAATSADCVPTEMQSEATERMARGED